MNLAAHPSRRQHSFILRAPEGRVSKDEGMSPPQDEDVSSGASAALINMRGAA